MDAETLGAADIHEILKLLPHRYPFLLIDRVIDIRGDEHGIGIKNVTVNEPQFVGHFPHDPVMPGVLMIEGMAQTAGVLVQRNMPPPAPGKRRVVFFLTIDKAKFRKPARPGDVIAYHVDKLSRRRSMWWYRAEAKVNDVVIAEAEVGAYLAEE
jgi:3-hydroxyacyl-[acyl-carrier-protein] dehydratase